MLRKKIMTSFFVVFALTTVLHARQPVVLAENGRAHVAVVVAPDAADEVRETAGELADYLGRISGTTFEVIAGDGTSGLAVGIASDFPALALADRFDAGDLTRREEYLLRSHADGVLLIGATEAALRHAVWDFLYRLGYRQFFPGSVWESIPALDTVAVTLDTFEQPDYWGRRLSSLTSRPPDRFHDGESYRRWQARNRVADGFLVHSTHAYGAIIRANREEFEAHPQYRALVDGERRGSKFCISNPGLRQLVVDHAVRVIQTNPERHSISMDPSDGGGWCECDDCDAMGSVSDRVVILANAVAEAINALGMGDKYVGFYAYNQHCAPPDIPVHPRVVVTVAAGHLTGGWTPEALFDAWRERGGATFFGVFEYYCNIISAFLPRGQRASDLAYLTRAIPDFHNRGARMLASGTAYGNGAVGLGAYIASRMLWDIGEADRVEALYDDFLDRMFAPAREPMDTFFRLVYRLREEDPRMPLTEDTVGRMYRALETAREQAGPDAEVQRRIDDLILYTRYTELYVNYRATRGENQRVEAYRQTLRHAYRIRERLMVNVFGLFAYPRSEVPESAAWSVPESENDWKDSRPVTDADVTRFLTEGIAGNRVGDYEIRGFSDNLGPPARALNLPERSMGDFGLGPQGRQVFYTWVEEAPATIDLKVTGGLIRHYRHRMGNVRIALYSDLAVSDEADFTVATDESVPPDGEPYIVKLATPHAGLHRVEIQDGGGGTKVEPAVAGMPFSVDSGPDPSFNNRHIWNAYFYVPKGTRSLSFHVSAPVGDILDGDDQVAFRFMRDISGRERDDASTDSISGGYFTCPVPEGQDGRVWKLHRVRGAWRLLNVPPYLARKPAELLLPIEVIEADKDNERDEN